MQRQEAQNMQLEGATTTYIIKFVVKKNIVYMTFFVLSLLVVVL